MSDSDSTYDLLCQDRLEEVISGFDEGRSRLEPLARRASFALALALHGRTEEAKKLIEDRTADSAETTESVLLEAQMVVGIREKRPIQEIASLAESAAEKSESAVFALRVLGDLAERRRAREDALKHYQLAYVAAPESDRGRGDYARLLAASRRIPEAVAIVKMMKPSIRREIYRVSILLRGAVGAALSLAIAFLILAVPTSAVAFWSTAVLGALLVGMSLRWRDGLVFAAGLRLELLALGALLLRELLGLVVRG